MSDFSINNIFNKFANTIESKGNDLKAKMDSIDSDMTEQDMLKMQFQLNQYNTMLEMTSTVSKALTDEAKQIAQRAN